MTAKIRQPQSADAQPAIPEQATPEPGFGNQGMLDLLGFGRATDNPRPELRQEPAFATVMQNQWLAEQLQGMAFDWDPFGFLEAIDLAALQHRRSLTPPGFAERAEADPDFGQRLDLSIRLIETAGSGTTSDGQLVVAELVKLPTDALRMLVNNGTKVVVCRGSITDYLTELRGVHPRGWDEGETWDSVPGQFSRDRNEVIIATRGHGTEEGAHVPELGDGHGAYNLVAHEVMHAVDDLAGELSEDQAFLDARAADLATLDRYLAQPGEAGHEETFAEVAGRYYGGDPTLQDEMPHLYRYFETCPLRGRE